MTLAISLRAPTSKPPRDTALARHQRQRINQMQRRRRLSAADAAHALSYVGQIAAFQPDPGGEVCVLLFGLKGQRAWRLISVEPRHRPFTRALDATDYLRANAGGGYDVEIVDGRAVLASRSEAQP
jgi:hypothetical protein